MNGIIGMMIYQSSCFAAEICQIIFAAVCGVIVLFAAKEVYMRLPAHWLCDFDEQPWELHMPGFRGLRCRWLCAGYLIVWITGLLRIFRQAAASGASCGGMSDAGFDWLTGTVSVPAMIKLTAVIIICICATVIALSDRDYMIVPDQLVVVMGICSIFMSLASSSGDAVFAGNLQACLRISFCEIIYGALWGAALMLSVSAIGIITGKGAACGFGDVKLMMVCGAVAGERVFVMYILMAVMSGIYFSITVASGRIRYGSGQPLAPWICGAMIMCM